MSPLDFRQGRLGNDKNRTHTAGQARTGPLHEVLAVPQGKGSRSFVENVSRHLWRWRRGGTCRPVLEGGVERMLPETRKPVRIRSSAHNLPLRGFCMRKLCQKPDAVMWPFTECSEVPVERDFAAVLLWLERKHNGRLKAHKLRCHYLAANGRTFNWPRTPGAKPESDAKAADEWRVGREGVLYPVE